MSKAKNSFISSVEGVLVSQNQDKSAICENKSSQNLMISSMSENKFKLNVWEGIHQNNPHKNNATQGQICVTINPHQ